MPTESERKFDDEVGTCCFCGYECNPASQSCGTCAREWTGWSVGWNKRPPTPYFERKN